jgi:hypothetical protein
MVFHPSALVGTDLVLYYSGDQFLVLLGELTVEIEVSCYDVLTAVRLGISGGPLD